MSAVESPLRLHLLGLFGWVYFCDYDKKKGKKTSGTHVFPLMAHQNAISLIWGGNKEEKSCCNQMTDFNSLFMFNIVKVVQRLKKRNEKTKSKF